MKPETKLKKLYAKRELLFEKKLNDEKLNDEIRELQRLIRDY